MNLKETKDHYVARTYLRRFQDASSKLYVCNKDKTEYFPSRPSDICFERGWDLMKNSNDILWLKNILEDVEPTLNAAMTYLADNNSTFEDRLAISTYLAILHTLNPKNLKNMHSVLESVFQWSLQWANRNCLSLTPEGSLANGFTIEDLGAPANTEETRRHMANNIKQIGFSIYTSTWAIIKNTTRLDFFTSDNPFYFLALPVENNTFAKYIALDPKNLLLVFPPDNVNVGQINEPKIEFTGTNSGKNIYLEASEENEIALFNTNTIWNANRFIIMQHECEKLKKLISSTLKASTQSSRTPEQQEADMKIFFQLFDKSRQIKKL